MLYEEVLPEMLAFIRENAPIRQHQLCELLDITSSAASYHTKRMQIEGHILRANRKGPNRRGLYIYPIDDHPWKDAPEPKTQPQIEWGYWQDGSPENLEIKIKATEDHIAMMTKKLDRLKAYQELINQRAKIEQQIANWPEWDKK